MSRIGKLKGVSDVRAELDTITQEARVVVGEREQGGRGYNVLPSSWAQIISCLSLKTRTGAQHTPLLFVVLLWSGKTTIIDASNS